MVIINSLFQMRARAAEERVLRLRQLLFRLRARMTDLPPELEDAVAWEALLD